MVGSLLLFEKTKLRSASHVELIGEVMIDHGRSSTRNVYLWVRQKYASGIGIDHKSIQAEYGNCLVYTRTQQPSPIRSFIFIVV